ADGVLRVVLFFRFLAGVRLGGRSLALRSRQQHEGRGREERVGPYTTRHGLVPPQTGGNPPMVFCSPTYYRRGPFPTPCVPAASHRPPPGGRPGRRPPTTLTDDPPAESQHPNPAHRPCHASFWRASRNGAPGTTEAAARPDGGETGVPPHGPG